MGMTSLAIIHKCPLTVKESEVIGFIGALDTQIRRDFSPAWGKYAIPWFARDEKSLPPDVWKLYLWRNAKSATDAGAFGYHANEGANHTPVGHVFVETSIKAKEPWTAIASHEALEMLADEWVNLDVTRRMQDGTFELWPREICDAVQGVYYEVNGVQMSDFVLPEYFIEHSDGPYDFKRALTEPFGIHESGYSSVLRIRKDGKFSRRDVYGVSYPAWRKEARPMSRKSTRFGGLSCVCVE